LKKDWVLFVASRYIFKGRSNSPVLAVLGIATGVLALIVIIAVMNGFQLGFIESILEISSYHLRLENFPQEKTAELQKAMLAIPSVKAAVPFKEFQALARGAGSVQQAVIVRGLKDDTMETDEKMKEKLEFEEGFFDIRNKKSILLGTELARRLGLEIGDEVTVFSISGILSAEEEGAAVDTFEITGIFRTDYYEYDCSWAIINIENTSFAVNESDLKIGIKLLNRFHDGFVMEQAKKTISAAGIENVQITSWREYNRAFFGALRTEKLFMFILVGLIFIVVGLNIFQAQRRSVLQRQEEIGLLRAVGGTKNAVRFVFTLDGAIIGLTGASLGLVLGMAIAFNIQQFFSIVEMIVNEFIGIINILAGFLGIGRRTGDFAVFSRRIFYIKEIPSRVIPHEVIIIFLFGFLSALLAAWFASQKTVKIQPAEVLRYE